VLLVILCHITYYPEIIFCLIGRHVSSEIKCALTLLQLLTEETEARKKFEKFAKGDTEQMWSAFQKSFDEQMKHMKEAHLVR